MFAKNTLIDFNKFRLNIKFETQYKIPDFKLELLRNKYGKLFKKKKKKNSLNMYHLGRDRSSF